MPDHTQLEAVRRTENNLRLLRNAWDNIHQSIKSALKGDWIEKDRHTCELDCVEFREVLSYLPAIRGQKIVDVLPNYTQLSQAVREVIDLDAPDVLAELYSEATAQAIELDKYARLIKRERRNAFLWTIEEVNCQVTPLLEGILVDYSDGPIWNNVEGEPLMNLRKLLEMFRGEFQGSVTFPPSWGNLQKHLRFHQVQDMRDILERDWPDTIREIQNQLESQNPLPVEVEDLAVGIRPSVSTVMSETLRWTNLTAVSFENFCADLLRSLPRWENVRWPTHTNSADRSRDLQAEVLVDHPIHGTQKERVLVQCKHFPNGSVSAKDIESLQNLLITHGNIDSFIVITSGKFSDSATHLVEDWNGRGQRPKMDLWERWFLEGKLIQYPDLIAKYGLRS